jgi:hypothetical protein
VSETDTGCAIFAAMLLAAAVYGIVQLNGFLNPDGIVAYKVFCPAPESDGHCPKDGLIWGAPVLYSAKPEIQSVVWQSAGAQPNRLDQCIVMNENNWTCEPVGFGRRVYAVDGAVVVELAGAERAASRTERMKCWTFPRLCSIDDDWPAAPAN